MRTTSTWKRNIWKPALLVLLASSLFAGCSTDAPKEEKPDDNYKLGIDYPHMFAVTQTGLLTSPAEQGYYFLQNNLIYYMDKESGTATLLDTREGNGCLETPYISDCHAVVKTDEDPNLPFIQYYNSKLYVAENYWGKREGSSEYETVWEITEMDTDGTNRKTVKQFSEKPYSLAIHRGDLYFSTVDRGKQGNEIFTASILRSKLDGSGTEEVLHTAQEKWLYMTDIVPYRDQIYWQQHADEKGSISRLDLNSKRVTTIGKSDSAYSNWLFSINNDRIYFNYYYGDLADSRSLILYSSDLLGNDVQKEEIAKQDVYSSFRKDAQYTYAYPVNLNLMKMPDEVTNDITVFKNGQAVSSYSLDLLPYKQSVITGDDQYMFIYCEGYLDKHFVYLDKQAIEAGEGTFKRVI